MGVPVVTTETRGCRETVLDGRTGRLVPVRASRRLAGALEQLSRDRSLRETFAAEARAWASEAFDVTSQIRITRDVYRHALYWPLESAALSVSA